MKPGPRKGGMVEAEVEETGVACVTAGSFLIFE
jgi:hypothetical protein